MAYQPKGGESFIYWDEKEQAFVVPDGACPYPIRDDDGTVECCVNNGHCGCIHSSQAED